jgi:hypothetical protein
MMQGSICSPKTVKEEAVGAEVAVEQPSEGSYLTHPTFLNICRNKINISSYRLKNHLLLMNMDLWMVKAAAMVVGF